MSPEQQNDILSINQVQLLLSEKRTVLAVMRTGIAVLALPLSIFSALIATSRWYRVMEVWPLLLLVVGVVVLWCTEPLHGMHPALVALLGALLVSSPHFGSVGMGKALKSVPPA